MKNSADLGGCYPPRPSASVDNTLLDLQNSSYPTRPHSIIVNYQIISSCLFGSISAAVTAGNPEHDSSNLVSLESGLKHGVILYNEAEVFSLSIGSFSNDDGDGKTTVKDDFIFFLRMSQLCKSAQYAYRSKNLLRLNMHPQRSIPKEDTKN